MICKTNLETNDLGEIVTKELFKLKSAYGNERF